MFFFSCQVLYYSASLAFHIEIKGKLWYKEQKIHPSGLSLLVILIHKNLSTGRHVFKGKIFIYSISNDIQSNLK